MKRVFAIILTLSMILCAAGCGAQADTPETTVPTGPAANAGELKAGTYAGSAEFSEGEFSMAWNFTVSFLEDGTFILCNDAGEEKGAGTYALTDACYTMTYTDARTCTVTVLEDGSLEVTTALPYGQASIDPEKVDGIVLTYVGEEIVTGGQTGDDTGAAVGSGDFTIAAGTYTASYTKESAMAGTVVYNYTAEIGADGTFSYAVTFDMGGTVYDGSAASGTYTVDGGSFVFTDSEGNVTEGAVTAENTLVISLMASAMAKEPYEVTFTPAV